jgi:FRG domain
MNRALNVAWKTFDIYSWNQFEDHLPVLGSGMFYRGQADATWGLVDSLTRYLGPETPIEKALQIEKEAAKKFKEQAHLFLDPYTLPDRKAPDEDWWPLMQHFGAPTRLLDWTLSPYVAAYFAAVDHLDKPGTIWAFPESELRTTGLDMFLSVSGPRKTSSFQSVDSPQILLPSEYGEFPNVRMITQQGRFTLPGRILSDHGALIVRALEGRAPVRTVKLNIHTKAKYEILLKLLQVNITANTLFPGLDGLGRSIREYVAVESLSTMLNRPQAKTPVPSDEVLGQVTETPESGKQAVP